MSQLIVFLALAFSIVIAIFAVQNTTPVAVQFLGFRAESVAVSVLVLVSAALGAAAILLLGLAREVSWRWRHRGVSQQLKTAQARVTELEALKREPGAATGQPVLTAPTATPIPSAATPPTAGEREPTESTPST